RYCKETFQIFENMVESYRGSLKNPANTFFLKLEWLFMRQPPGGRPYVHFLTGQTSSLFNFSTFQLFNF
ncbi:MAG: hypothetical protein RB296_08040, partial [Acidobacteriota bacterium]|nr:hypothetical protein [Acidobacteriota bacterium]